MKRDIVYILKNDIEPDELRYSLRSVCENFPCKRVVFVGGMPDGLSCDLYIPHQQTGVSKWEKSTSSLKVACENESLTEEIFLFNDDFFVLREVDTDNFINYTNGTLGKRIRDLEGKIGKQSAYSHKLKDMFFSLKKQGKDTMSFAVHMPMLINRHKALELFANNHECYMFRSLYGNTYSIPYLFHKDVKVYTNDKMPESEDYLSTTEESFNKGIVGEYIRNKFSRPCKYELGVSSYAHELYSEEGDERYYTMPLKERR